MELTCAGCGSTTFAVGGFARATRHGHRFSTHLCANCQHAPARWWLVGGFFAVVAALVASTVLLYLRVGSQGLSLLFLPVGFLLAALLSVVGVGLEVVVTRLLGFRILGVVLGAGDPAASTVVGSVVVASAWVPVGGSVNGATYSTRLFRTRRLVAGSVAPLVGLGVFLALLGVSADHGTAGNVRSALLFAAAVQMLVFLFAPPSAVGHVVVGTGYVPRHFLSVPFLRSVQVRREVTWDALEVVGRAIARGDRPRAARAAATATRSAVDAAAVSAMLLDPLLRVGATAEALTAARTCLEDPSLEAPVRGQALSVLTWCEVLVDRDVLVRDRGAGSREAAQLRSWDAMAVGAHGAVLVELGDVEDGLEVLRRATDLVKEPFVSMVVATELAIAHARFGEGEVARVWLADAQRSGFTWARLEVAARVVR